MLIGSLANRSASDGLDVFPNLGYKKDAFLEPYWLATTSHFSQQTYIHHSYHQHYSSSFDSAMSSNNLQQQQLQQPIGPPGLNPVLAGVVPRGPAGPLPVDALGHSARSVQEGGEMRGNMFVIIRGDHISRPPQGCLGGPYPGINEVSEGI